MSDWADGYVKEIDYTYDYYSELNPQRSRLALLNAGLDLSGRSTGACCELGFGFGVSANIHSAAGGSAWWGTDFNPTQARFASDLAEQSGAAAHLFDQAFAEFCHRPDLPEFDFIGLHGIWSWVSDDSRRLIVDFVRRRLRLGGVLYVSYNTQPGLAQIMPLRQLLIEHADTLSPPGAGVVRRIDAAVEYAEALMAASPGYAAFNPTAANRIKGMKGQSGSYLAHEYFNRDWQPMLFSEFARWLAPAKVGFACSAHYPDHVNSLNLLAHQVSFLDKIPDPAFQQSSRDFLINRQFRKDYWVKGPRRLEAVERQTALRAERVLLLTDPSAVTLRAGGALVEQALPEAIYRPVIDALAERKALSLGELEARLTERGIGLAQLLEAIMVLIGKGDVVAVQDEATAERAASTARALNRHLIEASALASRVNVLASPVTGGGVAVQPFRMQMLQARAQGLTQPGEWAEALGKNLQARGSGLLRPDGTMMSPEESRTALVAEAQAFADGQLPMLQTLRAVE